MVSRGRANRGRHRRADDPAEFDDTVRTLCQLYAEAPALREQGVHLLSTDEKTGIQALERAAPTRSMRPGDVEAREFEYIRHGTQTRIANLEVATGRIVSPTIQVTRAEADFAEHIRQTVARDPSDAWIFITDQLNTHQSETLVRYVAAVCEIDEPLGVKGQSGILESMETRAAFLQNPNHRIRLVYTPKHASWLNQVEIWFSILVRRVLRRGDFTSTKELRQRLLDFIEYFNNTLAKSFKWTYAGRALTA